MYFRNCDFVRVAVCDVGSIWIGEIIIHITILDTQQARCIGALRYNDVKLQNPVCDTYVEAETWENRAWFNLLRPRQDGRNFPDNIFKAFSWMKLFEISIKFDLSLFLKV